MSDDQAMSDDPAMDDQASVDRAFAELVAGFHVVAEHSDPPDLELLARDDTTPAPGSVFEPPRRVPPQELPAPDPVDDEAEPTVEQGYDPGPPPPLPRPAWPILVGWIGLGYAMVTVLIIAIGFELPAWAGWAGVIGFVGGFALLVSRLPRSRPPDAGDGAVL